MGTQMGSQVRAIHRLSAADLRRREPGVYADGGGLLLQVSTGRDGKVNRSWLFRYTTNARTRDMGLGSLITVSLSEAREAALQCRKFDPNSVLNPGAGIF